MILKITLFHKVEDVLYPLMITCLWFDIYSAVVLIQTYALFPFVEHRRKKYGYFFTNKIKDWEAMSMCRMFGIVETATNTCLSTYILSEVLNVDMCRKSNGLNVAILSDMSSTTATSFSIVRRHKTTSPIFLESSAWDFERVDDEVSIIIFYIFIIFPKEGQNHYSLQRKYFHLYNWTNDYRIFSQLLDLKPFYLKFNRSQTW